MDRIVITVFQFYRTEKAEIPAEPIHKLFYQKCIFSTVKSIL